MPYSWKCVRFEGRESWRFSRSSEEVSFDQEWGGKSSMRKKQMVVARLSYTGWV